MKDILKQSAISKSGLIVYLSSSEENRKRTGIAYPPGSYNLLREYPNTFETFRTDMAWSREPKNTELLENLREEMYESIMIVERPGDSNRPEYGFVDRSQIEVNLDSNNLWLGFSIEPPDFNFRLENNSTSSMRQDRYGDQSRREANMRYAISRNLGRGEDWYIINVE